ncbi:nucleoside deaminase [Devriesea agamarum]|uniref:nucleoside deaminase n=1 Tax=Devriesea agamarum TaxID=472569 RepID=UPI00071D297C|nr:nucleoside deaminase [Devriesea agamarum]
MRRALEVARQAAQSGDDGASAGHVAGNGGNDLTARADIPIGAVVADENGHIIAVAGNRREADQDPTAHAEILALREAARIRGRWNLTGCTLAVTLEPCTMCAGAIVLSRIDRLIIGAMDPKAGAAGSLYDLVREPRLNHRVQLVTGVRGDECSHLLKEFFRSLRARGKRRDLSGRDES